MQSPKFKTGRELLQWVLDDPIKEREYHYSDNYREQVHEMMAKLDSESKNDRTNY